MLIDTFSLREDFQKDVKEYVTKKDWRRILLLRQKYGMEVTSETLWTFPTEYCLTYLKALCKSFNIKNVLSIGCGSGLLEFVLQVCIGACWIISWDFILTLTWIFLGVKVTGLEVDKSWWSRQSSFIPLKFLEPDQAISPQFLLDTCMSKNWNFALLFCYFNNREAFNEYVKCYRGNFIIIIGPEENTNRYTEPMPNDKEFQQNGKFKLIHLREFGNNRDLLAIYEKNVKNLYA